MAINYMPIETVRSLRKSFIRLAANPKPAEQLINTKDLVDVYLTQDSIVANFQTVFGYKNENLALRFYNILANGYNGMHVYLPIFLAKLQGMTDGYPMQMNLFGFKMLDSSQKGEIYSTDISDMI